MWSPDRRRLCERVGQNGIDLLMRGAKLGLIFFL
jgi:hypothetical protein